MNNLIKHKFLAKITIAIAVFGILFLFLIQASNISKDLSIQGTRNLIGKKVEYLKSREEGYLNILRMLANKMSIYEEFDPEKRRDGFDDILKAVIEANPDLLSLYTIWKPNAIDAMDGEFTGRAGSTQNGQYAVSFTREKGRLIKSTSCYVEDTMAYLYGPASETEFVSVPFRSVSGDKDAYLFRMMVPVINPDTREVVGGVGCVLSIDEIQEVLQHVIDANEDITIMVIYANNGFILAHVFPERIGKFLSDVDVEYGGSRSKALAAVQNGLNFEGTAYDPTFNTNVELTLRSFSIGHSDMTWSILIGTSESYIKEDINNMTGFTIILAVLAIVITAALI